MRNRIMMVALLLVGCTDAPKKGDVVTYSEVCTEIGHAYCVRAIECGADTTQISCENEAFKACCANDGICGNEAELLDDLQPCLDAYDGFSCQEMIAGNVPPECLRL